MTRPGELRMREFKCDTCGAEPSQPCESKNGHRKSASHAPRFYAAHSAGRLPIYEEGIR